MTHLLFILLFQHCLDVLLLNKKFLELLQTKLPLALDWANSEQLTFSHGLQITQRKQNQTLCLHSDQCLFLD